MLKKRPVLFLILLVIVTYANTIRNGYNFDDQLVTNNHYLTSTNSKSSMVDIFTKPYYSDKMGYSYGYRPITLLSFYIENHLLKESPHISHFINVILFCLTVIALYKLIHSIAIDGSDKVALLASVIFALHPIHTEVVNSIKNRDELLALLFALLSFRYLLQFNGKNYSALISAFLIFSLSILSKKSTIPLAYVMPTTLLLVRQINYKSFLLASLPLIVVAFLFGGVLNSNHILTFGFISLMYLATIYILYNNKKIITTLNTITISQKFKVIAATSIQFAIYFLVIWFKQFGYLIISLPFYYYLFKTNKTYTIYLIIIQALAIDWILNYHDFGLISLFIAIGLFVTTYINSKLNTATILLLALTIILFNYNSQFLIFNFGTIIITFLFFFSVERKIVFAIVTTAGTIAGAVFFDNTPLLGMLMLLIVAYKFTHKYELNSLVPIILSMVILAIVIYPSLDFKSNVIKRISTTANIKTNLITDVNSNNISEGRSLSFIENSLITESSHEILVFTGLSVLGKYLFLNLLPYQLSFYYGYSVIDVCNSKSPASWLSLLLHIILIVIAFWKIKKQPLLTIGILWYIASITFFSNWIELVAGVVGERLSYNASVGFSIFISGLILGLKPAFLYKKPFYLEFFVILILTLFFLKTVSRNTEWFNPTKLMSSDIKHLDNSAQANNMYGIALMSEFQKSSNLYEKEELINKALFHFKRTISIYPKFFNAHIDLSKVYIIQGKLHEARRQLIIAYGIEPKNLLVIEELIKINFDIKNIRALIYYTDQYLRYDEKNEKVYELISHLLFENGKTKLALKYSELGLKHFPNNQILLYIYNNDFTSKGN